jgi:Uncharacterized protein conserved in bacteria
MRSTPFLPNAKTIEMFADKLGSLIRQSPAADIEANLKAGVTAMLGRLDVVSREEFDVQTEVLARTREKLGALETRLAELERQVPPRV